MCVCVCVCACVYRPSTCDSPAVVNTHHHVMQPVSRSAIRQVFVVALACRHSRISRRVYNNNNNNINGAYADVGRCSDHAVIGRAWRPLPPRGGRLGREAEVFGRRVRRLSVIYTYNRSNRLQYELDVDISIYSSLLVIRYMYMLIYENNPKAHFGR